MFEPYQQIDRSIYSASKSQRSLIINIDQIQITLIELFQPQYDSYDTFQYLSNISKAILKFKEAKFRNGEISISETILSKITTISQVNNNAVQSPQEIKLRIPNVTISMEQAEIDIKHDAVVVNCERQELALLGKLFSIINSRIKFDEYRKSAYNGYLKIGEKYYNKEINFTQMIIESLIIDRTGSKVDVNPQNIKERSITYIPDTIDFNLRLHKLTHRVSLPNAKYSQQQKITGIVHRLQLTKIIIQYKSIKEFLVNSFQLVYEQSAFSEAVSIFINDISMIQNYDTLIQYLISFTLFKKLLQLTSTSSQQPIGSGKKTSKNFSVQKISMNYISETVLLKNLIMNKECAANGYLEYQRLTLGRCDIILNQMQGDKSIKYPIPNSHNLLTITSLSLNTILVQLNKTLKQKTNIHIKSPNLNLPEINIPKRVTYYLETYAKLQIYIQAYMKNVTDDQLRIFKQKMNDIVRQPSINLIKVTDLTLSMDDSLYDTALLNHYRFGREYLSRHRIYNETQLLSELRKNCKVFKLCEFHIQSIQFQHQPIEAILNSQDSVESWVIKTFQKGMQEGRLRMAFGETFKLIIKNVILKVRDYPMNPLKMDGLMVEGESLKIINIYNQIHNYWKCNGSLGQIDISIGLNLLSGLSSISNKIKTYTDVFNETVNTEDWLKQFQNQHTNSIIKQKTEIEFKPPYWHTLHKHSTWNLTIIKNSNTNIYLLTQSTPYSLESINIQIGPINLKSTLQQTALQLSSLLIFHHNFQIIRLCQFSTIIKTEYKQPLINIYINCKIGEINNSSKINKLTISKLLIDYIINIKQIRPQWLVIYGLIDSKLDDNSLQTDNNQINYLQIANMAANKTLQKSNRKLSIISVIQHIYLKFSLTELETVITNSSQLIRLSLDSIQTRLAFKPDRKEEVWRIRILRVFLKNVVGRVGGNPRQSFLVAFRKVQSRVQKGETIQECYQTETVKNIFVYAKGIKFSFRAFQYYQSKAIYATRILEARFLKGQISIQLKETIDKLIRDLRVKPNTNIKVPEKQIAKTTIEKFREIVKSVVRKNRKKRTKIMSVETILKIDEICLGVKTAQSLLILGSKMTTRLVLNTIFSANDKYFIDPMLQTFLKFTHLTITVQRVNHMWIFEDIHQSEQILTAQALVLKSISYKNERNEDAILNKQRINKCWCEFRTGMIEMTSQSSDSLKQIINFIIDLMDRRAMRQRLKRIDSEKYAELKNKGKNNIKEKLQWTFSDVKKEELLFAVFEFTLAEMNINLLTQSRDIFMKIQSQQMLFAFRLFTNARKQFNFQISKLSIINFQEDPNSVYRQILSMNHNQQLAMQINAQIYSIPAFSPQVLWQFYRQIKVHVNPLKVKFTQEIYSELEKFFFGGKQNSKQKAEDDLDFKYSYKIPNYLRKLYIDDAKVQVWYRTQSMIKRMEGISVGLDKFQVQDQFWTYKELYYSWIKFVLKQLASQFFNVIGQKLFGP